MGKSLVGLFRLNFLFYVHIIVWMNDDHGRVSNMDGLKLIISFIKIQAMLLSILPFFQLHLSFHSISDSPPFHTFEAHHTRKDEHD